ncbi:MAG: FG-GAP repeat domain-containing protein, partial [Paracoccaceae bacterium]
MGDLDHDGYPDLISGCGGAAAYEVMAWQNDGTPFGGVWAGNGLGGAGDTHALALGDLDNDGWLDVVSGATTAVIDAWRNDGTPFTGLWSIRQIVGNTVSATTALALGDLDRDGDLDIASGDANQQVRAWQNDETPFDSAWTGNTVGDSKGPLHAVAVGDLDGDGDLEIVSDVDYPDLGDFAVAAWQTDSSPFTGLWSMTLIGAAKDAVLSLAVGDVDRDGKPDIVSGSASDAEMELVAWGNPAAPFADPWTATEVGASTDSIHSVVLSDLDADGDPDIVSGSGAAEDYQLIGWENTDVPPALGNWVEITQPLPDYVALAVDAADLDHDGRQDLVAGTKDKGLVVWQGDGGYTWTQIGVGELPDTGTRTDVAWGQLNNQREVDLVAASYGDGLGAWAGWELGSNWDDISGGLPIAGQYEAVALGHIDYDGYLDVAACGAGVGVRTWQGTGTSWNEKAVVSDTLDFCDVALGDVNLDGHLDLVATSCDDAGLRYALGDGGHGYLALVPLVASGKYGALALGDINRDGIPDVAAASGAGGIEIWSSDGGGTWALGGTVAPTLTALGVDLGDFDNDGYLDLLVGHSQGVRVWRGDGGTAWHDASTNLPTTGAFEDVIFARIDEDAALDIVAAESAASGARVWTAVEPPPGGWTDFTPATNPPWSWLREQQPTCTVQVADAGSGLDVSTAEYRFSRNGGATWEGGWLPAAITGADGTTDPQTMTAADVAFDHDSENQNVIQFRISDLKGYTGTSPLYTVAIDVTPPTNPTSLSTSHTVGSWTSSTGIAATWSGAYDATSGVHYYSYSVTASATGVPDETADTEGTSGTRYATGDGQNWYFHVRAQDWAGNWASGATHAGPYWIDGTNPVAPSSLSSSSHTVRTWSNDPTINAAWNAATDGAGSGIADYRYSWTHGSRENPTANTTTLRTATSPSLSSDDDWYLNLQARDNVGRLSDTVHLGPFYIDVRDPFSRPSAPSTSHDADFTVSWTSWEPTGPQSGPASADIAYRDVTAGGGWQVWLSGQAPSGSATFHATDGHIYDFRSRARDVAGNVADWPTVAQATTVVASLDLEGFALEVTQAVQDLNNSVDLIANKRTYVRFHVRALSGGDHGPIGAQLSAWRDGAFLGTIPPNNPGGTITVRADPDRGVLDHSFYFDVPTSWLHGTVAFEAEANTAHTLAEYAYENNDHREDVTFRSTPTMHVKLVDACYRTGGTTYHVRDADRIALASWLRRAYPISNLDVSWGTRRPCYTYRPEAWEVNVALDWNHFWSWVGGDAGWYDRWYGMVDDGGG